MLCCALMAAPPHGPQHRRTPPPHVGKQQDVQTGAAAEPERLNDLFSPIVRSSSPPPPPPKKMFAFQQLLEETRSELRRPLCNAEGAGWGRLGSGGVPTWGTWLRAGGGSWQPPALPRANKQTETRHSQHGEGGRGVGELKSCLLGSLGGKAAGGKQSKANWLGG